MPSIESLGIGSGLLTNDLVDQLVSAEKAVSQLRIDTKTAIVEAEISAYGTYTSSLDKLKSAADGLSNSTTLLKANATVSDEDAMSVSTASTAEAGSYQVEINQVATAQSIATKRYDTTSETVGTGTLTFNFGKYTFDNSNQITAFDKDDTTASTSITIDSSNNTLGGVRDAINKADMGVTATLVNDGQGYRIMISSDETGEDMGFEINVSGDAGLQALGYSQSQQTVGTNMELTQRGLNADVNVNGLNVTSASNSLGEVIKGVTINVEQVTNGPVSLNVKRDTDSVVEKVDGFIEAYNEYKTVYTELTKYNVETNVGGLFQGESTLRTVNNQIRSMFGSIISGLGAGYQSLSDIGITTDQHNDYNLKLNTSTLKAALEADSEAFSGLLANQKYATDSNIKILSTNSATQPGEYNINISQVATQASMAGLTNTGLNFASPVVIGGSNDEFTIKVDGSSAAITLDQGSYSSGDDLALMLQNNINSAFSGKSVTVEYSATDLNFSITSSKYGSESEIGITSVDSTLANTLGLNVAGAGEVSGSYFTTLDDHAFGATTPAGIKALAAEQGVNFSTNQVNFDLTLSGTASDGTYSIQLDEDKADILDTNGNVSTDRNREDVLNYIQSELNNAGLSGIVTAEFNSDNRLVFATAPASGTQSIGISNLVNGGADYLGLENQAPQSSGLGIFAGTDFELSFSNRYGAASSATVSVPAGTYETGDLLATEIQNQINSDPAVMASANGAETTKGGVSLASTIDFTADEAQFAFELNGTAHQVTVNSNGSDNLDSIQQALDAELIAQGGVAGDVVASLSSNGLVLSTAATGSNQVLEMTQDGIGATSTAGTGDLSSGIDFSTDNASFTLKVDGIDLNVVVDGNGTAGTNNGDSNLAVIQQALDTALLNANGGGEFSAGDVVAKLNGSNQLYFETVAKNGLATSTMYGADAAIEMTAVGSTASDTALGLSVHAANTNGFDGFGLDLGAYKGFDGQATVNYQQDSDGKGRFVVAFDNETTVNFVTTSSLATAQLGFEATTSTPSTVKGVDVEGTINGVEAKGKGQYLTAQAGNESATNGYVLGGTGADFSSAVTIDGTNNTLKVNVDGTDSGTITLTSNSYASGQSLADELSAQINADSALAAAGKKVEVQYDDATSTFGIFSFSKGVESSVSVTDITSGGVGIFGITTTTATVKGKDAEGEADPSQGLMLKVSGTNTGDRGSVNYIEGIADQLNQLLDAFLGNGGVVSNKENALMKEQTTIEEDQEKVDARSKSFEARLKSQFAYNDLIISSLKTTEDFMVQQFELMQAALTNN